MIAVSGLVVVTVVLLHLMMKGRRLGGSGLVVMGLATFRGSNIFGQRKILLMLLIIVLLE